MTSRHSAKRRRVPRWLTWTVGILTPLAILGSCVDTPTKPTQTTVTPPPVVTPPARVTTPAVEPNEPIETTATKTPNYDAPNVGKYIPNKKKSSKKWWR